MREYRVICVDDDEQFLRSLERSLPARVEALCQDFRCVFEFFCSAEELFEAVGSSPPDGSLAMVISDQMMTGISGIELIERLRSGNPGIASMLLTGYGGLDSAKYAINRRLLDQYVSKPIDDIHAFASLVANLLHRHHLDREERDRTDQLAKTILQLQMSNERVSAMQNAAEEIAMLSKSFKGLDLQEVVAVASREVPKIFKARRAVLCLGPGGSPLQLVGRQDCPRPEAKLSSRADGPAALEPGGVRCDEVPPACLEGGGQSPCVMIPLSIGALAGCDGEGEELRGFLCVCDIDQSIAASTDLIKYKADLTSEILSASLTNARLYQQAKQDSQTDCLTGANTRRILEAKLEAEYERAVRYKHPFCVVIVDVDRFKTVNDESGHVAGDEALKELTDILGREIRKTDTLARYGGDEFVILMPETSEADAANVAERMRAKAESTLLACGQTVTISCGIAGWSGDESESSTAVLRRADAALYKAKRAGRNNVTIEAGA